MVDTEFEWWGSDLANKHGGFGAGGELATGKKLNRSDVLEIKRRLLRGLPQKMIAKRFGVSPTTISDIATKKRWRDVKLTDQEVSDIKTEMESSDDTSVNQNRSRGRDPAKSEPPRNGYKRLRASAAPLPPIQNPANPVQRDRENSQGDVQPTEGELPLQQSKVRRRGFDEAIPEDITPSELAVMYLICDGCANKVVAQQLDIANRTVELKRAIVFKKMGVRTIAELAAKVARIELMQQIASGEVSL